VDGALGLPLRVAGLLTAAAHETPHARQGLVAQRLAPALAVGRIEQILDAGADSGRRGDDGRAADRASGSAVIALLRRARRHVDGELRRRARDAGAVADRVRACLGGGEDWFEVDIGHEVYLLAVRAFDRALPTAKAEKRRFAAPTAGSPDLMSPLSLEVPQPADPVTPAVPDAPVSPAVPDPGTPADPEEPATVPTPQEEPTPAVPEPGPGES
jgi:hypothetical protein